ncbi:outer membrane protein [Caulobacter ginsengisoli]|uniref:Outer membrane protein n=1 Tax=Caulobacter ginsengisoli TaxID=400775 RepID=A0ABU0INJ6_9CAUL|nr:OmpW family outer membrane protein [Caulobacter ginsengisoli]MDQ0463550.1 outer membrane protein [Caulobacter ginsengisoli]
MTVSRYALALLAGLAMAGAALPSTVLAEDFQPKEKGTLMLNVRLTDVDPKAGNDILTAANVDTGLNAEVSSSVMPTIGLTYFMTDNLALEVIAGTTKHKISASGLPVADTWVLPPVVALQYHFNPKGRVSPYVGAGVNYMLFYGTEDKTGFKSTKVDNGFGYALQAGADVAIKGPWSLNVDVKKIYFETDATTTLKPATKLHSKVDLDPWVLSVGFGYRF